MAETIFVDVSSLVDLRDSRATMLVTGKLNYRIARYGDWVFSIFMMVFCNRWLYFNVFYKMGKKVGGLKDWHN